MAHQQGQGHVVCRLTKSNYVADVFLRRRDIEDLYAARHADNPHYPLIRIMRDWTITDNQVKAKYTQTNTPALSHFKMVDGKMLAIMKPVAGTYPPSKAVKNVCSSTFEGLFDLFPRPAPKSLEQLSDHDSDRENIMHCESCEDSANSEEELELDRAGQDWSQQVDNQ